MEISQIGEPVQRLDNSEMDVEITVWLLGGTNHLYQFVNRLSKFWLRGRL